MAVQYVDNIEVGTIVKTNTGFVARVKSIDNRFPLNSSAKFPIIYTDDGKTCWSYDSIVEYGWNIV